MTLSTRKILDASFGKLSMFSLALMCALVVAFTMPILIKGAGAFIFTATSEHEKFLEEFFGEDLNSAQKALVENADIAKQKAFRLMEEFETRHSPENELAVENAVKAAFGKLARAEESAAECAKLPSSERRQKFAALSQEIWKDFGNIVGESARRAENDGTSVSFEKFLTAQSAKISQTAREVSAAAAKRNGLNFGARNALRRALVAIPEETIAKNAASLSRKNAAYFAFKDGVNKLLGPSSPAQKAREKLPRNKYGQTRMDMAEKVFENSVSVIRIKKTAADGTPFLASVKTEEYFKDTPVEKIYSEIRDNLGSMLAPHVVFYGGFFTRPPVDANIFGGIFPMILGTFYLTLGAMLIAAPLGIIAAVYFSEYARENAITRLLRMCVGTLAGVPSIVFGLFGLAFLINTLKISDGKSVLAGATTLALLILPTIIQSCVEALKCVPNSYREASYGLGAGKWKTICSVILPAALPGMLTGIIISMGRAAGETAPIIFTAATSTGAALSLGAVFSEPTPALPWNIYNICSEHEAAEMVEHVQYGMVFTLMAIVLSLNAAAILLRAKLQKK